MWLRNTQLAYSFSKFNFSQVIYVMGPNNRLPSVHVYKLGFLFRESDSEIIPLRPLTHFILLQSPTDDRDADLQAKISDTE